MEGLDEGEGEKSGKAEEQEVSQLFDQWIITPLFIHRSYSYLFLPPLWWHEETNNPVTDTDGGREEHASHKRNVYVRQSMLLK